MLEGNVIFNSNGRASETVWFIDWYSRTFSYVSMDVEMRGRNGSMLEGRGNGQKAALSRMRSYALTIGIVGPFFPVGRDF